MIEGIEAISGRTGIPIGPDSLEPQTLAALLGVGAVVTLAQLPLNMLVASQDPTSPVLEAAGYAFLAWWLVAMANILSRALDRSLLSGVLLALGQFVLSLVAYQLLFDFMGVKLGEA